MRNPSQPHSPSAVGRNSGRRHSSPPPVSLSMQSSRSPPFVFATGEPFHAILSISSISCPAQLRFGGVVTDSGHAPARFNVEEPWRRGGTMGDGLLPSSGHTSSSPFRSQAGMCRTQEATEQ
jgi:hypothetical protein